MVYFYNSTEYVQAWMGFWFDENKRLNFAKTIQTKRIDFLNKIWGKDKDLQIKGITPQVPKGWWQLVHRLNNCHD
jgi:CRISPR/Cas system-associated endonuclease Cas1